MSEPTQSSVGQMEMVAAAYRRAFVRYPCNPAISCQAVTSAKFHYRWAEVLDISQGGIGLLLGRTFELGTPLNIVLKGDSLCELQARVVNFSPRGEGRWQIGCQFVTPLRADQLQALL